MTVQNPLLIKEKIISFVKIHGPSLPVQVARETGLSILFASAFLSELYSEKRINISDTKVGNSPLYLIPGQEALLENFWQHLKSREKDAFLLLKEKKFLKDSEQSPVIRVALREIKDFAIPFKKENEIFWRYFLVEESELPIKEIIPVKKEEIEIKKELTKNLAEEKEKEISKEFKEKEVIIKEEFSTEIIPEDASEMKEEVITAKEKTKKKRKKEQSKKNNEKFFEKVKEFLSSKSLEIVNIEYVGRNELVLRVKEEKEEWMLVAINKKRVSENDIIKAHKKTSETGLKYKILTIGEAGKRIENLLLASRNLEGIEKLGQAKI